MSTPSSVLHRCHPESRSETTIEGPWRTEGACERDLVDRERHGPKEMLRVRELLPSKIVAQRHTDKVRDDPTEVRPCEAQKGRELLRARGSLRAVARMKVQLGRSFETPPVGVTRTRGTLRWLSLRHPGQRTRPAVIENRRVSPEECRTSPKYPPSFRNPLEA